MGVLRDGRFVSIGIAARAAGISRETARELAKRGRLRTVCDALGQRFVPDREVSRLCRERVRIEKQRAR